MFVFLVEPSASSVSAPLLGNVNHLFDFFKYTLYEDHTLFMTIKSSITNILVGITSTATRSESELTMTKQNKINIVLVSCLKNTSKNNIFNPTCALVRMSQLIVYIVGSSAVFWALWNPDIPHPAERLG